MKEKKESIILEFLQDKQYATVEELSKHFSVSVSTIRRKLDILTKQGLIIRTHGGAKPNYTNNFFPSFTFRVHENSLEKKKMALSAIKLINDGDVIFLDGTTSAFFIAEYLSEFNNIRVITNGIDTLSLLAKNGIPAYSTGGVVSSLNPSVLVGRYAEQMIKNFHADIAFFSTRSIDQYGEIYDCFEQENFVRKAMLENASKKVFLCDSSKFNSTSTFHLCSLSNVDYVVSNTPLPTMDNLKHKPKNLF